MRAPALSICFVAVPLAGSSQGRLALLDAKHGSDAAASSISNANPAFHIITRSASDALPAAMFRDLPNSHLHLLQAGARLVMNTPTDLSSRMPSYGDGYDAPDMHLDKLLQASMSLPEAQRQQVAQLLEGTILTSSAAAALAYPPAITQASPLSLLQAAEPPSSRPQSSATGRLPQLPLLEARTGPAAQGLAGAEGTGMMYFNDTLLTEAFIRSPHRSGACEAWREWDDILSPRGRGTFRFVKTLLCSASGEHLSLMQTDLDNRSRGSKLLWWAGLSALLLFLGLLTRYVCNKVPVLAAFPEDPHYEKARGHPRNVHWCTFLVVVMTWAVFGIALATISVLNTEIEEHPETTETIDNEVKTVTRSLIESPGQRAFIASITIPLSMMVAVLTLTGWRRTGSVPIRAALLAQFISRGATFAVVIALLVEGAGGILANNVSAGEFFGTLLVMSITGFAEEGAKVFAFVVGTCLSTDSAEASLHRHSRWFVSVVLVESEHALMLAGMAVGFGFMTAENAGYLLDASTTPPMTYTDDDGKTTSVPGSSVTAMAVTIMCVRLFLNIHPWLAGISASRVARIAFKDGHGNISLTFWELLVCFFPSAVVHAAFDFIISIVPVAGIVAVPGIWLGVRMWFRWEWMSRENGAGMIAPRPQAAGPNDRGAMQDAGALVDRVELPQARNSLRCC